LTNKISSAVEAIAALMKLRSRDASVHVDFAAMYLGFSFDGHISDLDDGTLTVTAVLESGDAPVSFTMAGLQASRFDGDFREDETGIFLLLDITRPRIDPSSDAIRIHIRGSWDVKPPTPARVN